MKVQIVPMAEIGRKHHDAWADLSASAAEPNPFFEPGAALPAAELLDGGADGALLTVESDAQMLLALPIVRRRRFRKVPVRALSAWHHAHCFLGTPLIRTDRLRESWTEVLDLMLYRPEEDAWLVLERLPLYGPVSVALHDVLAQRFEQAAVVDAFGRPILRRRAEETYLEGRISARHLKSLRRQRRRLGELLREEAVLVDHAADDDSLERGIDAFLALEHSGWKGRAGTSLASRPGDAEFFRRLCRHFASDGRLQIWILGTVDRPAAAQCNILAGDAVFHFKTAFDEELRSCSPGLQLELEMVSEFHRDERLQWLDSCVDRDNRVSSQLYPDRAAMGTMLVPGRGRRGVAAVRAAQLLTQVRNRARALDDQDGESSGEGDS